MKKIKLDLDFLIGPIIKDVFSESKQCLVTGVEVIDNDELTASLDKAIMELYSSFYSFDDNNACKFDIELAKSHKEELTNLINQLIWRLESINDGSFEIENRIQLDY
jgi:hypothetical protein